jgi:hypothetical protein
MEKGFKGKWQYIFLFSHLKELLRLYIILFYRFFHILLTSTNILIERNEMSAIFNFCKYACHVTTGVTQYFILTTTDHFALKTILCLLRDHSKPLKNLPINIWSATNTFIWLIPVMTSPKLPLMKSKMYSRLRTSDYFK